MQSTGFQLQWSLLVNADVVHVAECTAGCNVTSASGFVEKEEVVVSKCANPQCDKPFHYLHEGKLFRLMFRYPFRRFRSKEYRVEYLWLCGECAPKYSLSWNRNRGMGLVPLSGVAEAEGRKLVFAINGRPVDRAHDAR
jgi:hypothetical protein